MEDLEKSGGSDPKGRPCYLAITSGTAKLSVALSVADQVHTLTSESEFTSIDLLPLCDRLFKTASVKPSALDGIILSDGPGSYTGLRSGFAAAMGLSASYRIPVRSLPVLFWGRTSFEDELLISAIEASPADYYLQRFIRSDDGFRAGGAHEVVLKGEPDSLKTPDSPKTEFLQESVLTAEKLLRVSREIPFPDAQFHYPFTGEPTYGKAVRALTRKERLAAKSARLPSNCP